MPEGRFVSKSISTSGQLKRVSLEADYLFGRMIPHLDRDGRLDGDPDVVKATACPLRSELTPELIATCLAELDALELVVWYEVDTQRVLWFPTFREHQQGMKPERERPSRLPSVDAQGVKKVRRTASGLAPDVLRTNSPQVKVSEVKVSKAKSSEVKVPAEAGPPKGLVLLPKPLCDTAFQKWGARFGAIDYGQFRKELLKAYQPGMPVYTEAEIVNGIEAFYEWWIELDDKEQGFNGLTKFIAQLAAKWVPLGKMPLSHQGELTERGAWAGSKAIRESSRRPRLA